MEGETATSISQQQQLWNERILPTLDNNIKSGNSLVDTDFYDAEINFGCEKKIKPFDWVKAFPDVFNRNVPVDETLKYKRQYQKVKKLYNETETLISSLTAKEPDVNPVYRNAGFDIIIGNPPYVKVTDRVLIDYFSTKYKHQDYQQDLYLLFLERYQYLLAEGGKLGVIIPNTWLQSVRFRNIRRYLMNRYFWNNILHFNEHVFKAVVDTHVLIFDKNSLTKNDALTIDLFTGKEITELQTIDQNHLPDDGDIINILSGNEEKQLFEKIKSKSVPVKQLCDIYNGVKPYEKGKGTPPQTDEIMQLKPFIVENKTKPEGKDWYPLMRGSLMHRYVNFWNNNSWIKYGKWLAAPRKKEIFEANEKIIVRQTGDSIIATIIGKDIICRDNLHLIISNKINLKFLLGILNSSLMNFSYFQINPEKGEILAQVKKAHIEQLPIPIISTENTSKVDEIAVLVELLLLINKDILSATLPNSKELLEIKKEHIENKINQIIYSIYQVTTDEIKLIEAIR